MKTKICKCEQCLATRKRTKKKNRIQTKQVRAARHRVRRMIHMWEFDALPGAVAVDYYA